MEKMAEQISEVGMLIISLSEINDDTTVPRNVRTQIQVILASLKDETELSIKVNKALSQLDEMSNDVNIQSYTRTQIWNIMSVLEKLH